MVLYETSGDYDIESFLLLDEDISLFISFSSFSFLSGRVIMNFERLFSKFYRKHVDHDMVSKFNI